MKLLLATLKLQRKGFPATFWKGVGLSNFIVSIDTQVLPHS